MVADGIITNPVDMTFDIIWRKQAGGDTVLATFTHHFDPRGGGNFDAVPFDETTAGPAAAAQAGDSIVWRMTTAGTDQPTAFIPNGDGANANGRIPFIEFPQ